MAEPRIAIQIDGQFCLGNGECAVIAPDIFQLEDGISTLRADAVIDAELAALAERSCPSGAIRILDIS